MASNLKATPRASGEQASLELERPLGAGLSPSRPLSARFHGPEGMVLLQAPRDAGRDEELLRGFLDAPSPGLEGAFAGVTPGPDGRTWPG